MEKVQRQCEQLKKHGCMIEMNDGTLRLFTYERLKMCFPETKEEGFNNGHLVELLLRNTTNMQILERIAP